jgi:uncharacterized protein (TIGR02466 family)
MQILTLFPVAIGMVDNPDHKKIKKNIIKESTFIKDKVKKGGEFWGSDVYNTLGTYNIVENDKFNSLHEWLFEKVRDYAITMGYKNKKIQCKDGWINFYKKYDYQDVHDHDTCDISAVYYVSIPKNSGNIMFYTHETRGVANFYDPNNQFTWKTYSIEPREGMLLMFKSNLQHRVDPNKTNQSKITLAYNFKVL